MHGLRQTMLILKLFTKLLYLKFLCHLGEEPRWKMSQWLSIKVTLTIVTLFIWSNDPIEAGGKQTAV